MTRPRPFPTPEPYLGAPVSRLVLEAVDRHREAMPDRPTGSRPTRADALRDLLDRSLRALGLLERVA